MRLASLLFITMMGSGCSVYGIGAAIQVYKDMRAGYAPRRLALWFMVVFGVLSAVCLGATATMVIGYMALED